jgi:AraC-like DNA-binding protein
VSAIRFRLRQAESAELRQRTAALAEAVAAKVSAGMDDEAENWLLFHQILLPFARQAMARAHSGRAAIQRVRPAVDLVATNQSIKEIAFAWGFHDASHFNRAFKDNFSVIPSAFRRERSEPPIQ